MEHTVRTGTEVALASVAELIFNEKKCQKYLTYVGFNKCFCRACKLYQLYTAIKDNKFMAVC